MKRSILTVITLFVFSFSNAQVTVFSEDFEGVVNMTSSGNPTWFLDLAIPHGGAKCMRDTNAVTDSAYLTTAAFSTVGYNSVMLDFWHICKISFADGGYIEVSNNNGASWVPVMASHYLSASGFINNSNFSASAYGLGSGWYPTVDDTIPQPSWYRHELFDISILAANSPNVLVRFKLLDGNNFATDGNYGWLIDDVTVVASPNELIPPHIAWSPSAIPLQGNIPSLGPFTIKDTITDPSFVSSATLFYSVNGGAPIGVAMTNIAGNIWQGVIPTVLDGDTICYFVQAADSWGNTSQLPSAGSVCIYASSGIHFPWYEDFESNPTLWTATTIAGSSWEYGTPSFGVTNSAHSGVNAWDIDLVSVYQANTEAILTSPPLNFNNAHNPTLSFWRNHFVESNFDGTRLEYTTDGGASWLILGAFNDPKATNWYNDAALSTGLPAWTGNSLGWVKSSYRLGCLFNTGGVIQLRFVFTSDGIIENDGFSIDDFAIELAPARDVGVTAILQPGASAASGSSAVTQVVVTNFGDSTASGFTINYSINGGTAVSQAFIGNLQACDADTITFTTPYTVPLGTFGICAFTTYAGDTATANDSTCKNSQGVPLLLLDYADDFEIPPAIWWDSSRTGTNWQLGTPNFGTTNTSHSPLNAWDINLNSTYGNNARSVLTSPYFDFTTQVNAKLSFWMNRNTAVNDGTYLEYSLNGGANWQRLGTVGDTNAIGSSWYSLANLNFTNQPAWDGNSNGWLNYTYILGAPFNNSGTGVQFRFVFTSNGFTTTSGVSIDDFTIKAASPVDIGVTSVNDPLSSMQSGTTGIVNVSIRNYGTTTVTSADVSYRINGVVIATEPWTGSLAPSTATTFTFATPFTIPVGRYDICGYTTLVADGDHSNDTNCTTKHGVPLFSLPFWDSFDTGAVVWVDSAANPLTNWQLGTPNFRQTTGAHSPPYCWDINLDTVYFNDAGCYLTSPYFDFTPVSTNFSKLTFWHNFQTETTFDGTRLEYSTDSGSTWQVLGSPGNPLSTRWYNRATIASSGLPAWAGTSVDSTTLITGWIKSTYKLAPLNGVAKGMLRFVFTTDGSVNNFAGYSIDDFKIIPPSPFDASALIIVQPGSFAPSGVTSPVRVVISNEGYNPISNFDISYSINGVLSGTFTYPGTLQPSVADTVTLPAFNFPTGYFDICAFTQLVGDGDLTNDTTCNTSFGIPTVSAPYFNDLETNNYFFSPNGITTTQWEYGIPASAVINSAYSPVNVWKTNLDGTYAGANNDDLYTPFIDFTGAYRPELRFFHWYETSNDIFNDGGRIDISTNGGLTWSVLGALGDTAATNWYTDNSLNGSLKPAWAGTTGAWVQSVYRLHQLENWNGGLVQFRFNFRTNAFNQTGDGWAIDNFEIFSPFPNVAPVDLSPIFNPFYPTGGNSQADSVKIKNKGSLAITDLDVTLRIDGVNLVTDHITYSPPLLPGASQWHTFTSNWNPLPGGYQICAITSNPNGTTDINPADDSYCVHGGVFDSVTVTNTTPYCNDFETGNGYRGWIPLNAYSYALFNSDWQLGTPNKTNINSAHSGSKSWVTKITGDYNPRDSSGVFSPVFAVDTLACYELSFWHNYYTEQYQDGGTVEYSTNNGTSWHIIGFAYESNWFNSLFITGLVGGPPTAGWSGAARVGWEKASHNLKFNNIGHVIFRFRFGSDLTNEQEGWTIDDVCFKRVGPCTIGIDELAGNSISLDQNYPNPASDFTILTYSIPQHGKVRLSVTDVLGREVNLLVNESQSSGIHRSELNVKNLAEGMYYCTLEFGTQKLVRKLVVAR